MFAAHVGPTLLAGGTVLDPMVVDAMMRAGRGDETSVLSRLTDREGQVLQLVASGLSNASIAEELHLSVRAVEKHVSSVMDKLGLPADDARVHRRVRAAALYLTTLRP